MANELKLTTSIVYVNGQLKKTISPGTINLPQAAKGVANITVAATTAEADVSIGGLGTPGYAYIQSLEATTTGKTWNWGLKSSTGGIPQYFKLPPKSAAFVCYGTSGMTLRGKMASGTATIDVFIFEN